MTISGGYFLGIPKDLAVRFSFLLSIPIIVGSGLVKMLDIMQEGQLIGSGASGLILGFISAFVFGWLAIDFLLKFLRSNTFMGFVVYRVLLAAVILIWLV